MQVPNPPGSGKDIAEGKGAHREVESELSEFSDNLKEAGCGEHTNPRANFWSDEQKPHMRLCMRVRLQDKLKSNNYTKSCRVNVADGWLAYHNLIQ